MAGEQCAGACSGDALVKRVLALPGPLASRIGAAAEALSLLAFCGEFPADCRLVAQTLRSASLLGRVQRDTARAAPLCVLVDLAALLRRPGALAACLRWMLGLPNLRAVQFADGGKGSMLDEEELGLMLQLVAAHPEAAAGLRHLATCTRLLGRQFDASVLASLTRLRSLELKWYSAAHLGDLPPSVRSVALLLPGGDYRLFRLVAASRALAGQLPPAAEEEAAEGLVAGGQALLEHPADGQFAAMGAGAHGALGPAAEALAGHPAAAEIVSTLQQLHAAYVALGYVNPLPQLPHHQLDELSVDADGMRLSLSAGPLFAAARSLTVARADLARLILPQPVLPGFRGMSLQALFRMASPATGPGPAAQATGAQLTVPVSVACAEALLEAFRAAPALAAACLDARKWLVGLAGYPAGVEMLPDELLQYVTAVLRSCPERFGYLWAAGGVAAGPLDPWAADPEPARVPLLLTRSTRDSLVVSMAAGRCRGASKALCAVLACWAAGIVLRPVLGLGVLSSGSGAGAWLRLGRVAAVLGIPAVLLGSLAQQLDTL